MDISKVGIREDGDEMGIRGKKKRGRPTKMW